MNDGRIVQIGTPRDIYFRPANDFVADFVGSTNLFHGTTAAAAETDAYAPVMMTGGEVLRCLFPYPAAARQTIAVSIRPETVTLAPAAALSDGGRNRLVGTVVSSGFLGSMNRYTIRVGDVLMQAHTAPDVAFVDGAEVAMQFPLDRTVAVPS